jgi:hypothetical protein
MKSVCAVVASLALGLSWAGSAAAADGHMAPSTLRQVGLPGFRPMSDAQAATVRGQGFALVFSIANGVVGKPVTFPGGAAVFSAHGGAFGFAFAAAH